MRQNVGIRLEPLKVRLLKLRDSDEYQKAFDNLKKEILGKNEEKVPSKIEIRKFVNKIIKKQGKSKKPFQQNVSLLQEDMVSFFMGDRITNYRKGLFFKLSSDMRGSSCKYVPLTQVQNILSKGNINKHDILIPEVYSDFRQRWKVTCLFDPVRKFGQAFDPFVRGSQIITVVGRSINDDNRLGENPPITVDLRCDLKWPTRELVRRFEEEIRFWKSLYILKERRAERYSAEDISEVDGLKKDGLTDTEIFRKLHPEHIGFQLTRDYEIRGKTENSLDGAAKLQRIKRLSKRASEKRK